MTILRVKRASADNLEDWGIETLVGKKSKGVRSTSPSTPTLVTKNLN
jgi:hypothetical protein